MAAYTNTYAAVTWTSGDTITETKADKMVSNDQAYDSHTAEGFQLDNNVGYSQKEAAGTRRLIANVNASDILEIGTNNQLDHTTIYAGTSKLVKIKVLRQDNTTDSYQENTVILTGYGIILQTAVRTKAEIVTLGITFSTIPIVLVTATGSNVTVSTTPQTTGRGIAAVASIDTLTTSSFRALVDTTDGGNFTNGKYSHYSWLAIGELN